MSTAVKSRVRFSEWKYSLAVGSVIVIVGGVVSSIGGVEKNPSDVVWGISVNGGTYSRRIVS